MTQTPFATAADYADALLMARKAKNVLAGLLLLMLLVQLGLFFAVRYDALGGGASEGTTDELVINPAATQPATQSVAGGQASHRHKVLFQMLEYLTALINFMGIVFAIVLAVVVLLIVQVMLVGRLIGLSHTTAAFIWCILLAVLLFPWQAFLANGNLATADFRIPGVLYTWGELMQGAHFDASLSGENWTHVVLKWARFVGFPGVAILLVILIGAKTRRGVRLALGEDQPPAVGNA